MARLRYRFGAFNASPARRVLLRSGQEVPLIPRYFDLLLLLLERRHEAVTRQEIFDRVWSDVVVSDGALSQAIRTLRRTLGDDVREPVFIRTVSRHGYRFVHRDVVEEPDETPPVQEAPLPLKTPPAREDAFETVIPLLMATGAGPLDVDDRREAAEALHVLGIEEALRRLDRLPGHEAARALLRDTRWDVPGSGPVPLFGQPGAAASSRWAAASGGGAAAGLVAGLVGGLALEWAPFSAAPSSLPVALALVGAAIGGLGAAGVDAGLAIAEALARSLRGPALVICGALGGGGIGAFSHALGRWTLEDLFGRDLSAVGGGFEGVVIGAAAGLGYALATPRPGGGGMATPRGQSRLKAAAVTGIACAAAGVLLTWTRGHLLGVSLDFMARTFQGSQVGLAPLARVFGETEVGPVTRTILSAYEGFCFGLGLILGLTRRPR
ncbi:MAG TPA: winged helix-turn-helix domain-containing protein [Candidatus Polarisedimenticolia bacterium]|jgi:DNA-binding winged helix-turn-helix (wHTH) protein